jgi:YVTN family beta-propeller protein
MNIRQTIMITSILKMHMYILKMLVQRAGTLIIVLLISCTSTEKEKESYLEDALQKAPDAYFEQAFVGSQDDGTYIVATSQRIDPAGTNITFPGRPVDLALSPDESVLAVKNINNIVFINTKDQEIIQTLALPKGGNTFTGIIWNSGKEVWTTDTHGRLRAAERQEDGQFAWTAEILLPGPNENDKDGAYPGGIAIDHQNQRLFVTLNRNNTLGVVNLETNVVEAQISVGIAPYAVKLVGDKAYVSNWGGRRPETGDMTGPTADSKAVIDPETGIASSGTVSVIDLNELEVIKEIEVGLHPSGMMLSPDQKYLYVANANSDFISEINTTSDLVERQLSTKPMEQLPLGSAPNAVAISPDGKDLYVANGGNNALAVIEILTGKVRGLIPTGWYPGAVTLNESGSRIYVANIKGIGTDFHGSENTRRRVWEYGGKETEDIPDKGTNSREYLGSVSVIDNPDDQTLEQYTMKAAVNMRLPKIHQSMNLEQVEEKYVPVPTAPGEKSVFKHVLYIIKENRTYDQIFGDLPQGKGDPDLCFYGREVTPNHHKLAEEFVLLDNTYCNGVLSADGHQWTDEGMVTDYIEKSFGGFERSYPYDGDDALAYASSGFIWDYVLRANLTFRNYGEFVGAQIEPSSATWSDNYNDYLNGTSKVKIKSIPQLHTLEPYTCPTYIGFPGTVQDVYRAGEFIKELKAYEETGQLPNFMIMLLPNDHTVGTREGFPTPRATVADNDLALGRIVEAVSHSKFWNETAIFVIEDDPQAGLDHVDGRRTIAFCISPYTKRGEVISTHYNQNSILRTMELILGLPPMNQFDMAATVMTDCFTETPDFTPYIALENQVPLDEMNPSLSSLKEESKQYYYAKKSMEMNLDDIDQADEGLFNRILWHDVKGYDVPYPVLVKIEE